jgi:hypothetical protein
MSGWS